ncbi:MAG TPA: UbiA-like polyprenyltransferase [Flavitalea sp.]|nr:UbiA-like polyprenyltransferase [Flavitalea sp.]
MELVKRYLSLVKFSHTIFAMPFAMIGFFLALLKTNIGGWSLNHSNGWSSNLSLLGWKTVIIRFVLVLLCMVFARSAAMAFNRWLDAKFDSLNPRTSIREIPAGLISRDSAIRFVVFNCVAFLICTWFINVMCFILAPVALFIILFYSYTKRFTALCHLVLGAGLALAPIGAYIAVTGAFGILPLLFSAVVLFWVSGFDIIYALQDEEFDRSQRLHSIPASVGRKKAMRISEWLHLFSVAFVILAGLYGQFRFLYWLGTAAFSGMLLYQHTIIQHDNLSRVNLAFMTANGIASLVFAVFVIVDMFAVV